MGKSNYSVMQNQGLSSFWKNSWISKNNYNKYFFYFLTSNKVIENILLNFLKYSIINKKLRYIFRNKFKMKTFINKNNNNIIFIGRITFLKLNNWIITNINILFKTKLNRNKKKKLRPHSILSLKTRKLNLNYMF